MADDAINPEDFEGLAVESSVFDFIDKEYDKTKLVGEGTSTVGPMLRFTNFDTDNCTWKGTVLFVSLSEFGQPSLSFTVNGSTHSAPVQALETFKQYTFWRFTLEVRAVEDETAVDYQMTYSGGETQQFTFYVPGANQAWHWAFYSCNGWQAECTDLAKYGDITILWKDLVKRHRQRPMHALVGGGDQIYNDPVWHCPSMKEWLTIKPAEKRAMVDSKDVSEEAADYYFSHYCEHFGTVEYFKEALATIPSLMTWDDHDIFDGWGSYPPHLQECPVFKRIFKEAQRFYLLFQNHATPDTAKDVELFGGDNGAYSWLTMFGPRVALLGPDTRSQRSRARILSPEHWEEICSALDCLPDTVRHLCIVFAVPFVYGEIPMSEGFMTAFSSERRNCIKNFFTCKTGLLSGLLSQFDEPILFDDIGDHWTAKCHEHERDMVLKKLQELAAAKNVRISFLSGDVHVAGICRLTSNPDDPEPLPEPDYMLQVISSAIGNSPPPTALGKVLNFPKTSGRKKVDDKVWMHFLQLFKEQYPSNKKILLKRNWCDVWEAADGMHFELRVEDVPGAKDTPVYSFATVLPPLIESGVVA